MRATRHTPADAHPCAAVGCQHLVQVGFLMCMDHWRQVPAKLQRDVWTAHRELKRLGGDRQVIHHRYLAARQAAIDAVHHKQLSKKARGDAQTKPLF